MPSNIPYKSYFWSFGTTSYRMRDFNKSIEEQLFLLNEFWKLEENKKEEWSGNNALQSRYYDFMKLNNFVVGNANNKPKDAREKTSGLVDIGIIDGKRKLTPAGQKLLDISLSGDFSTDNFFQIAKDSYLYLCQLLKFSSKINNVNVRPFIILLYVLSKVEYLSIEEYSYLLPLCTNAEFTSQIIEGIKKCRANEITVDEIIIDRLLNMNNYQDALNLFLNNDVTENIICEIGLNRKSRQYDKPYFKLYQELYSVFLNKETERISPLYSAIKNIKIDRLWRKFLFKTTSEKAIEKDPVSCIKNTVFNTVENEDELKIAFFKVMHLLKAKATLSDYLDLNRRYINTTDIVMFEDGNVKLDVVPKHFFHSVADELYQKAYIKDENLFNLTELNEIDDCLMINEQTVISGVNAELGVNVTTIDDARTALEDNRYRRLQHLIDTKFTDDKIITLLDYFEERQDNDIKGMVTENADVPTIFEYVLGILWYKISDRQGKILDYMKLSLDADLLPKTHAAGGEADIVYEYQENEVYPKHTLILEATLANGTNQRRMEMEPVSRHLGNHIHKSHNQNDYAVFISTYLHINVISDFRNRKTYYYYNNEEHWIKGLKIMPLQTSDLKQIIRNNIKYSKLYDIFQQVYIEDVPPHRWYAENIKKQFESLNN